MLEIIIGQAIIIVAVAFVLRHFWYRDYNRNLGRLDELHQGNLKREEELKEIRQETEDELAARRLQVEEEIRRVKSGAEVEVQEKREQILLRAQQEADQKLAEAATRQEEIRARMERAAGEKAVDLAAEIIKRLFSSKLAAGIHHQLMASILEELEKLDGQSIKRGAETAEVRVPFSLTDEQRNHLLRILSAKAGRPVLLRESIDPAVLAGMVLQLDELVLDAGLASKLKETLEHVREALSR